MDKKKILLVDDDKDLLELYGEIFKNENFEVLLAVDGVEGLDIATKEVPDLIFTGIVMPRMDGFSMMETLSKTVMTSNIPVVISSHMGREEDRLRASVLGAKDFIVRGTTPPVEVVKRIKDVFAKNGTQYCIEISLDSLDEQKLVNDLGLRVGLICPNCNEKMQLRMKLTSLQERKFEAQLVCPKCG